MAVALSGKTIIITGASSGIGRATALACAEAGMHILLNARREDRLVDVAQRIRDLGVRAEYVVGDVTDDGLNEKLLDVAHARLGGFHAVYANAGYGIKKPVHELTESELRQIFEVNFFASIELLQIAARRLIESALPGHLLLCSSCVGRFTMPMYGAYSATKAAQAHVSGAMRGELKQHNIDVSSVHPIGTATEFGDVAREKGDRPALETSSANQKTGMFIQPPERVAEATVKCLRNPHPEVWTSFTIRALAGLMTFSPGLTKFLQDRQMRKSARS